MKNVFLFIWSLFLAVGLVSCSDTDSDLYEGAPLLNFNNGNASNVFVVSGSGSVDKTITYGTVRPAVGNHQVKLVFDAANSTAVIGQDFQIINDTDDLGDGETGGSFVIRLLEAGAVQSGKTAVFKLESATISPAGFNNTYTLKVALTCPLTNFVGSFTNTATWWQAGPGNIYDIVESTTPNQLLVKGFWDDGSDFVLNYNPTTYVITIPEQYTGALYAPGQPINARPSTSASEVSTFNPCTREVNLYVNYWVPALNAGFGNKVEKFVGL